MQFISVRELRSKSAKIWRELARRKELILTSNGHPIAFLCPVSEEKLEETLAAIRKARAIQAVFAMQSKAVEEGRDRLRPHEIEEEIKAVRQKRSR